HRAPQAINPESTCKPSPGAGVKWAPDLSVILSAPSIDSYAQRSGQYLKPKSAYPQVEASSASN
ncbi:MAG TPA: hypothetical protein VKB87_17075, partial [Myxococcaceae bacterium]|nr:hypothetical protein [Myxococcaceae bacterium]